MRWLCVAHEKEIPDLQSFAQRGFTPYSLGIGQFESLVNFAKLVAIDKPQGVVLAGTCGTVNAADVFKTFACQHFAFPKIIHEDLPEFMPRAFSTEQTVISKDLPPATVLQNHGVSLDQDKFAQNTGYIPIEFPKPILENMEAASIALACNNYKIPFTAILCVTNAIGPDARNQWKANFREAGTLLAKTLKTLAN